MTWVLLRMKNWHSRASADPISPYTKFINQREPTVTKIKMLQIIGESTARHNLARELTREEKFRVFCNVCDNALHAGQITKAQHTRWTNIF